MLSSSIGKRLASLPARGKLYLMLGGDAVFLPLCLLASVSMRLGSLGQALETAPWVQLALGLLTLPVLGYAGLYRTVVRYIDIRVVVRSCLALSGFGIGFLALAWALVRLD